MQNFYIIHEKKTRLGEAVVLSTGPKKNKASEDSGS